MFKSGIKYWSSMSTAGAGAGRPAGGWEGEVIKAGPKLVAVAHAGGTQVFRRETGKVNDGYGHQWCKIPEEHADDLRRETVIAALKEEFGITWTHWSPATSVTTPALEKVLEVLRKHAVTATVAEESST